MFQLLDTHLPHRAAGEPERLTEVTRARAENDGNVPMFSAARLTDGAVGLLDRLIGRLFRRPDRRSATRMQGDARAVSDALRLLANVGDALLGARAAGGEVAEVVGAVVPWEYLPGVLAEARRLIRPEGPDRAAIAADSHALLRRIGPALPASRPSRR